MALRQGCLLLVVLVISGCGPSYNVAPGSSYQGWATYIEDVEAPRQLVVGEAGKITLTLSSQQRPYLLTENVYQPHVIMGGVSGNYHHRYAIAIGPVWPGANQPWPMLPESAGNKVVFQVLHSLPGNYTLSLKGATARADGGSQITVVTTPSPAIFSADVPFGDTTIHYTVVEPE